MDVIYDVMIIGAGAVGGAVARELTKYRLKVGLLEKEDDVACGVTKANSGIIHGAFSSKKDSLKGQLNARATPLFSELAESLGFPYRQNGSLVVAFNEQEMEKLYRLRENGLALGMLEEHVRILSAKEVLTQEPNLNPQVFGALFCPISGIVAPYEYTIALIENALDNGLDLFLNQELVGVETKHDRYVLLTSEQRYETTCVVNCAGLYSDRVAELFGVVSPSIFPVKGQYFILERGTASLFRSSIFPVPTEKGKGILVAPTVHDNLLIGPDAETDQQFSKKDVSTDLDHLMIIYKQALKTFPKLDIRKTIVTFAGLRPKIKNNDFYIEEARQGLLNLVGIDSPGLTASPAIALWIKELLQEAGLSMVPRTQVVSYRKPVLDLERERHSFTLSSQQVEDLIQLSIGTPNRFVCRCERVYEATIRDALNRSIVLDTTDAVKRRTRAGAGLCQGQFCRSRVEAVIQDAYHHEDPIPVRRDPPPQRVKRIDISKHFRDNKKSREKSKEGEI